MTNVKYNGVTTDSTGRQVYDKLALAIENLRLLEDSGVSNVIGSPSVHNTLKSLIMQDNIVISKDNGGKSDIAVGEHTPDLVTQLVPHNALDTDTPEVFESKYIASGEKIIGFEHIRIGSRYTASHRLELLELMDEVVAKDKHLDVTDYYDVKYRSYDYNTPGCYENIKRSFKQAYMRHINKLEDYKKNMEDMIGHSKQISRSDIWFIVENVDSTILDANGNEIPITYIEEIAKIIKDKHPIGGIIYIGYSKYWIIPMRYIGNKICEKYSVPSQLNVGISVEIKYNKFLNKDIKSFRLVRCTTDNTTGALTSVHAWKLLRAEVLNSFFGTVYP